MTIAVTPIYSWFHDSMLESKKRLEDDSSLFLPTLQIELRVKTDNKEIVTGSIIDISNND
jgi:hypothetical protein